METTHEPEIDLGSLGAVSVDFVRKKEERRRIGLRGHGMLSATLKPASTMTAKRVGWRL